jgi:hypothetical protein
VQPRELKKGDQASLHGTAARAAVAANRAANSSKVTRIGNPGSSSKIRDRAASRATRSPDSKSK